MINMNLYKLLFILYHSKGIKSTYSVIYSRNIDTFIKGEHCKLNVIYRMLYYDLIILMTLYLTFGSAEKDNRDEDEIVIVARCITHYDTASGTLCV